MTLDYNYAEHTTV